MDPDKIFYFKNIVLIMLSFMAIASYMILSPSGIDLIFDNQNTSATPSSITLPLDNSKAQNKVNLL